MKQEFDAIIKQHEGMNAAYVDLPFDVEEVLAPSVKIVATGCAPYRGSIVGWEAATGWGDAGHPCQIGRFGDAVRDCRV